MKIKKININNFKDTFIKLGADEVGAKIMAKKAKNYFFYISDLKTPAANILKQDALSVGAELVVPQDAIDCSKEKVDAILITNQKQLELLIKKESIQPFGLKKLSKELKKILKQKEFPIKIMGVINANDDSFYSGSRFKGIKAIKQIEQMIEDGASIIDIGAVSSRPGSEGVSEEEELNRIKPICDIVKKDSLYKKTIFSIDSYNPKVIEYALNSGFKIVNDITGLKNDNVAKITASFNATIVIMHMQGTPKTMQDNPTYNDVINEIDEFFKKQIKKAQKFGIKDIILDVGIGFGKTLTHNAILLKNLAHFKHFGYELLIGASRKSMIDKIYPSEIKDRLPGTITLHLEALNNGANILRVHDVKEHIQVISIYQYLRNDLI